MFDKSEEFRRYSRYIEFWFSRIEYAVLSELSGSENEETNEDFIRELIKAEAVRKGILHD